MSKIVTAINALAEREEGESIYFPNTLTIVKYNNIH